jgi:hypothetical protein
VAKAEKSVRRNRFPTRFRPSSTDALGVLVGWLLLLERPTNIAKLLAGLVVTIAAQFGISMILKFKS